MRFYQLFNYNVGTIMSSGPSVVIVKAHIKMQVTLDNKLGLRHGLLADVDT